MEKVIGFSAVSFLCFLTKKLISKTEIAQNIGIEKKGKNQTIAAKTAPRMGLSTFPIVLDVSIIPSVLLASSSRWNMSPTSGNTIGIAPDAPKIGRASCRERAWLAVGDEVVRQERSTNRRRSSQ